MKFIFKTAVIEARQIHIDKFGHCLIRPIGNGFSMPTDIEFDITKVINDRGIIVEERGTLDDMCQRRDAILTEAVTSPFVDVRKYVHSLNME